MRPTPQQQAVIDHPLEPLRVAAGAGAGKTATMAWRLAGLINEHDIEPEQALGITFTNKAADQLRERLRDELPAFHEMGRSVDVLTYHGFAHSLLQEFGALVGVERDATLLGAGYQREVMRQALSAGAYRHLDLAAAGARVDDMASLWGHLGDNLVDPEDLVAATGDDVVEARSELASALVRYQAIKSQLQLVDFGDLIAKAHELVSTQPGIRARLRDRYRVVLLDEFQDTNAAQRLLLLALFDDGFPVTAVGDANQTIYEWRGASIENFRAFPEHFAFAGRDATTLPLTTNYRSDHLILDVANVVREEWLDGGTELRLQPRPDAETGYVGCAFLGDRKAEAEFIASEIDELHRAGTQWRDMACLFRRRGDMAVVREVLEANSIPVEVASLGGLLDVPVVQDLHAWLRILGSPDDAVALARLLLSRYRLGLGDIAPLARFRPQHPLGDDAEGAPGWAMLEAVDEIAAVEGLNDETRRRLELFRSTFRDLLRQAQGVSLVELCLRVLDLTETWQEVEALDDAARLSARLNLYRFLDLAEEWSPLEGRPSLRSFLEYLELLTQEAAAEELDTARLSGEDAVALLTVHRAKGLEWPVVFLPVVVDAVFPSRAGSFDDPAGQARSLPYELRIDRDHLPALPDKVGARRDVLRPIRDRQEWRTAYVAVTRAQHRLYLTGAHWYGGVKPKGPSQLFERLLTVPGVEVIEMAELGDRPDPKTWARSGATSPDPVFEDGWEDALQRALADPVWPSEEAGTRGIAEAYAATVDQLDMNLGEPEAAAPAAAPFRTSVTGLVTYATCPKQFFWSEVDRLPRRPSPAARRGVEVHRRIELHNRGTMALDWDEPGQYDVAPGEGSEKVTGAYDAFLGSKYAATRPSFVEIPFDLALEAGRVRGRIDAIYAEDTAWEIVDFKSGRKSQDPARRVQLEAYAVAATDVPFSPEPPQSLCVSFAYLGGGLDVVSEEVDAPWLATARSHLDELTTAAANEEYPTTPSPACHGCDFLRFCDAGKAFVAERDRTPPERGPGRTS